MKKEPKRRGKPKTGRAKVQSTKLKAQRKAFAEHYLETWNASEAARRAGYSVKTAYSQGSRLLRNVEVRALIEARLKEHHMSADEVLARLAGHASGSMALVLNESNELDLDAARENGALHLIKKLKRTTRTFKDGDDTVTQTTDEVELHDQQAALVHLGRYHKLFVDKVEHGGEINVSTPEELKARRDARWEEVRGMVADVVAEAGGKGE